MLYAVGKLFGWAQEMLQRDEDKYMARIKIFVAATTQSFWFKIYQEGIQGLWDLLFWKDSITRSLSSRSEVFLFNWIGIPEAIVLDFDFCADWEEKPFTYLFYYKEPIYAE